MATAPTETKLIYEVEMKFNKWLLLLSLCLVALPAAARIQQIHDFDFFTRDLGAESLQSLGIKYEIDIERYQMVTRQFGPTVIDLSKLPYSSPMFDSGKRAWSSWWYQKERREFAGDEDDSILAKYDRVFGLSTSASSAFKEENRLEKEHYSAWEGLCDAWALASLFYPEPKRPLTVGGETFSINELKGLIVKTFEAVPDGDLALFGEKFLGNADSWMFPDVFPDQFHRFVDVMLGEHKQAFLMDRDPGIEIWTVPVYKANYRIERGPEGPNSVVVKMWLFAAGANSYDKRNQVGTEEIVYQYVYELSGDLAADQKTLTINSGRWLQSGFVDSRVNHPDYLLLPRSENIHRASYNRYLEPAKVDRLVKGSL